MNFNFSKWKKSINSWKSTEGGKDDNINILYKNQSINEYNKKWIKTKKKNEKILTWKRFTKFEHYYWRPILDIQQKWWLKSIRDKQLKSVYIKYKYFLDLNCNIIDKIDSNNIYGVYAEIPMWRQDVVLVFNKFISNFFFTSNFVYRFMWVSDFNTVHKLDLLDFYAALMRFYFFHTKGLWDIEIILYIFIAEFVDFFHVDY